MSDSEVRELNALAKRFLTGSADIEELPSDSLKAIREAYKQVIGREGGSRWMPCKAMHVWLPSPPFSACLYPHNRHPSGSCCLSCCHSFHPTPPFPRSPGTSFAPQMRAESSPPPFFQHPCPPVPPQMRAVFQATSADLREQLRRSDNGAAGAGVSSQVRGERGGTGVSSQVWGGVGQCTGRGSVSSQVQAVLPHSVCLLLS